ncbi:hypothetical protein HYZ98_04920 [Candidatus Peregrinibacteria bacterium]|nr:hypothetical protein [Candidatus Peregrinibacteria bacterium]
MNQSRTFVHHKTGKPTTMDTTNIGQSKVSQQPIAFMSKDTTAPERQEKERSSLPIRQEAFLPAPAPDETDIETDDDDAPDTDGGPPTDVESISDWILTLHRQAWDFKNRYRARGVAEALTTQDFGKLEMIIEFLKGVELIYNDLHPTTGGDWMSRFVQRVKQEAKE